MQRLSPVLIFVLLAALAFLAPARSTVARPLSYSLITGRVSLQGRTDTTGVVVSVRQDIYTVTGQDGSFTFTSIPPGDYQLRATYPGFLCSQLDVHVDKDHDVDVGPTVLKSGDANWDAQIDLLDLVMVGNAYGQRPPADARADVNGDGVVDFFDLVTVGANFGLACPVAWTAGAPTPTVTSTTTSTPTHTPISIPSATRVPSATPTSSPVATSTETHLPTATFIPTETPTASPTATPTSTPVPPDVRITAINYDPPGDEVQREYAVIHNFSSFAANMASWTLRDDANHIFVFPAFTLFPGADVRVWTKSGTNTTIDLYWGSGVAIWNNEGDCGYLYNAQAQQTIKYCY